MSCCKCSKELGTEPSVKIGDKNVHTGCFNCAKCGGIGNPYPRDNDFFCAVCFHGKCVKCGKPTIGPHLVVQNQLYHKECYEVKKCVGCKKELYGTYTIIKDYPNHPDGDYHPDCALSLDNQQPKTTIASPSQPTTQASTPSNPPTQTSAPVPRFCSECGAKYAGGKFCGDCGQAYVTL